MLWHRNDSGSLDMRCEFPTSGTNANKPRFLFSNGGVTLSFFATTAFDTTTWHHCVWVKRGARGGELYIDGVLNNSGIASSDFNLNGTNSKFTIGNRSDSPTDFFLMVMFPYSDLEHQHHQQNKSKKSTRTKSISSKRMLNVPYMVLLML